MEEWKKVDGFRGYSVSTLGRIRNDHTGRIMALTVNQQGVVQVGLSQDKEYYKRAVALLVAKAFISNPNTMFNSVINLDGDRTNNVVENLMWRPRWFAIKYHRQFRYWHTKRAQGPVVNSKTLEVFPDLYAVCMHYGLLESDLFNAIWNRTNVYPTYLTFHFDTDLFFDND